MDAITKFVRKIINSAKSDDRIYEDFRVFRREITRRQNLIGDLSKRLSVFEREYETSRNALISEFKQEHFDRCIELRSKIDAMKAEVHSFTTVASHEVQKLGNSSKAIEVAVSAFSRAAKALENEISRIRAEDLEIHNRRGLDVVPDDSPLVCDLSNRLAEISAILKTYKEAEEGLNRPGYWQKACEIFDKYIEVSK